MLILSEKYIKIFDMANKVVVTQFQINAFFDDVIQNNQNENEIIGIINGTI